MDEDLAGAEDAHAEAGDDWQLRDAPDTRCHGYLTRMAATSPSFSTLSHLASGALNSPDSFPQPSWWLGTLSVIARPHARRRTAAVSATLSRGRPWGL